MVEHTAHDTGQLKINSALLITCTHSQERPVCVTESKEGAFGSRVYPKGLWEVLCGIKGWGSPWFLQEGVTGLFTGWQGTSTHYSGIRKHNSHEKKCCGLGDLICGNRVGGATWLVYSGPSCLPPDVTTAHNTLSFRPYSTLTSDALTPT